MSDHPSTPPSFEAMMDASCLDSYHKDMWEQSERIIQSLTAETQSLRDQVGLLQSQAAMARTDARRSREDSMEWRRLAIKLGSDIKAVWKTSEFAIRGDVYVSADIAYSGGEEAVAAVCIDLAKKLIAARKARGLNTARTGLSVHEDDPQ